MEKLLETGMNFHSVAFFPHYMVNFTGKVKSIGVSNFSIKNLERLLPHCTVLPVTNQVELHPCYPQDDLLAYCKAKNILLTAYSPFGMGNPAPVLLVPAARFGDPRAMGEGRHVRFTLAAGGSRATCVSFGQGASLPAPAGEPVDAAVRLDLFLWYARLAKTRSLAQVLATTGRLRLDGRLVERAHVPVRVGSVLVFARAGEVRSMLRVLGLDPEDAVWQSGLSAKSGDRESSAFAGLVETLLTERREARAAKDFATADGIRDQLRTAGVEIEDGPSGSTWSLR